MAKTNTKIIEAIDARLPIVIFCGPANSGKTTALIRLSKHIQWNTSFSVVPSPKFRENIENDEIIKSFYNKIQDLNKVPPRSVINSFLLLNFNDINGSYCQVLELPGEFNKSNYSCSDLELLSKTLKNKSPKIRVYVFFFSSDMVEKYEYAETVRRIINKLDSTKDKVIMVYNKVDKMKLGNKISSKEVETLICNEFNVLKDVFVNGKIKIDFTSFSSGTFFPSEKGSMSWILSSSKYPERLWELIKKKVKKSWFFWD